MVQVILSSGITDFAIARLEARHPLDEESRRVVRSLGGAPVRFAAGRALLESYASKPAAMIIVSGWAMRTRDLPDGRRQIYSFLLPGDVAAFRAFPRGWSMTTVAAISPVVAVDLTGHYDGDEHDPLVAACGASLALEQAMIFDQVARLGQRDAYQRAVDLLAELGERLAQANLVEDDVFALPLTQDHLADALGVTAVHVRRILHRMKEEQLTAPGAGHGLALHLSRLRAEHRRVCAA